MDTGTGLVHESPAFGEVDYDLLKNHAARFKDPSEIPLLCPVEPDGTFNEETPDLAGQWVKDADRQVIRTLKDKGILLHRETYRHDYPFCWRATDDPLIQYARPAWFIRTTAKKDEAIRNNEQINCERDQEHRERVERCVYEPLGEIGGSVSAEHGVGLEKKPYLQLSRSQTEIELMRTIKTALDPKGILNPGKIFDLEVRA